jgi:hypothetical protein
MNIETGSLKTAILNTRSTSGLRRTAIGNGRVMAAVLLVAGSIGAASSASAADVYLRTTTASTNLSNDGSPVMVRQVTIPAGTWVVTAKANPVNFGAANYVRCRLLVGNQQRDAGATLLGNAAPGPTGEMGPSVATIVLQTAITTTASKAFKLDCQHDFPAPGMYVDPGASILVVKANGPVG